MRGENEIPPKTAIITKFSITFGGFCTHPFIDQGQIWHEGPHNGALYHAKLYHDE